MTSRPDLERDEEELKALFDRTAETPDRMQLVKLKARAEDIPAAAAKRGRSRIWAPIFALAAGALAVFAARGVFERSVVGPQAELTASAPAPEAVAENSAAPPSPSTEQETPALDPEEIAVLEGTSEGDEGEPLAAIGDDTTADDPLAALDPPADDEIDQWLNATDAYLGGG